jgi:N-acetylglucosaminyldiphosphoundecaprenol N-acetyl-beta-D-mannosaminyltransferase
MTGRPTIKILGYDVFCLGKEFFSDEFKGAINTLSPHSYIIMACKDNHFLDTLMASDFTIPDGAGIALTTTAFAGKQIENISGSDLYEIIINASNKSKGLSFYLGSFNDTLRKIREKLSRQHPATQVKSYSRVFKREFSAEEN